jgi:thiol:disulfide interchange protein DsbC
LKRINLAAIALLFTANALFALTNAQIESFYKSKIPVKGISVKVIERVPLKEYKGFEKITIQMDSKQRGKQDYIVFSNGEYIFPDIVDVKKGVTLRKELEKRAIVKNLSKLYKSEKKENIVVLQEDKNKDTIVEFTDPECPYCNKKIQNIEETLKKHNVKLIFTPVHKIESLKKAAIILEKTKSTKSTEEKLKIIRKYYGHGKKADVNVSKAQIENIKNLKKKYLGAGIRGVPYIINEKELLGN